MEDIQADLVYFVKEKFPDAYAAFLTGSMVDGFANHESDYDVYIITHTRDFVFSESFVDKGRKLQAIHLPLSKVDEILALDACTRTGIHLGCFSKALILIDTDDYLSSLIEHCKKLFLEGPTECSVQELTLLKVNCLNLLSDLAGNDRDEEKVMISYELYKSFIRFYLNYHRQWNSVNKHLARQMKNANQNLSQKLLSAMKQFHKSFEPKPLLNLINKEIQLVGDIDSGYTHYSGLINVKSDYVVINVYGITDFHDALKSLAENIRPLISDNILSAFAFRTRPLGDDNMIEEGLYVVVQVDSKEFANEYLIPRLNSLFSAGKIHEFKFHYPVNFDFSVALGGEELLRPIFKIFNIISNKFSSNLEGANYSIFYSIELSKLIKKAFFGNDLDMWYQFLEFVNLAWLSRGYDNKKSHTVNQIIDAKQRLINRFSYQYSSQKMGLQGLLQNEIEADESKQILRELTKLRPIILKKKIVRSYQQHPVNAQSKKIMLAEWVIYKNILDIALGMLLLNEGEKSYIIYILKQQAEYNVHN